MKYKKPNWKHETLYLHKICLFLWLWSFRVLSYALLPLDNNMQTLHLCKFLLNLALCVMRRIERSGSSLKRKKKYSFGILELATWLRFLWYLITKDITLITPVVHVASLSYKTNNDFFYFTLFLNVCATEPACEMKRQTLWGCYNNNEGANGMLWFTAGWDWHHSWWGGSTLLYSVGFVGMRGGRARVLYYHCSASRFCSYRCSACVSPDGAWGRGGCT